jgi:hypothetical protein
VQAAAEALALISKSGLSAEKFATAMKNNGSNSVTLDMKLPMMMEGNFEPHFSVKHMLKDVVIATRLARNFGIEFGATDASRHGLTEEMRQGRGDADYSSLFRQYFPAGGPLGAPSNGEEDQPQLAGIDEAKTEETAAAPAPVPVAVETTAEVPSEAKAMGEVVPAPEAEPVAQEVAGHKDVASAPAEPALSPTPAPAPEPKKEPAAEAPKEDTILKFPTPAKEEETEEPRGLWGGFWRRQGDE